MERFKMTSKTLELEASWFHKKNICVSLYCSEQLTRATTITLVWDGA
jgi:hypothetical protein